MQDNSPSGIVSRSVASRAISISCRTPGCPGVVAEGYFGRCHTCRKNRTLYGQHSGRPLPRHYYADIYREVEKFCKFHAGHTALIAVVKWFDDLLEGSGTGRLEFLGSKSFGMLYDKHATGKDLLLECLSISTYRSRRPGTLAAFTPFVFVCGILKCATGAKRGPQAPRRAAPRKYHIPGYAERHAIAAALREKLTPLFVAVATAQAETEKLRNAELSKLSTEFPLYCHGCKERAERRRQVEARRGKPVPISDPKDPNTDMRFKRNREKEKSNGTPDASQAKTE